MSGSWKLVAEFQVEGEPLPKERARVGKGGGYTPERTRNAEEKVAWAFRFANRSWVEDPDGKFRVDATFVRTNKVRVDIDNLAKLVLDGLNNIVWKDDSQVVDLRVQKLFRPEGSTSVSIYRWEE